MPYIKKAKHITRKNYYLTPDEKAEIKIFILNNPGLTQPQLAEKLGVSRGTISNIQRSK
jgi:transcriptional regulator with XRE-family HTH domain